MNAAERPAPAPPVSLNLGGRSIGGGPGHRFGAGGPAAKPHSTRTTVARLLSRLHPHRLTISVVTLFVLAGSLAALGTPWLTGHAIDALRRHGPAVREELAHFAVLLALAYATNFLATWIQGWFMVEVAQRLVSRMRQDLFEHLQRLPLRFFDARADGDILSRFQNDLDNLSNTLSQNGVQLVGSLLSVGGALGLMLWMDPVLSLAALLPVPLGFFLTTRIAKACHRHFADQSRELGRLNGLSEETVAGLDVVRTFGREKAALEEFREVNVRLWAAGVKAQIFSGIIPPTMGLVNNLSFACATLAGGWLVIQGRASIGEITAFTLLTRQFARPLSEISTQFNLIQASLAGVERIFEILDEEPEPEAAGQALAQRPRGHVVFEAADFSYVPGVHVLRGVSLEAVPGQTVALVGPTGSGKTTIVNLLARFYDLDAGAIRIDGTDIRDMHRHDLRRSLGIVLQDAHLFTGTIRENLRYGNPSATEEEIRSAARLANAEGFILRLPDGYDTLITEAGSALSQGERQLLTIARAFLADPAILVLDEATSNVDTRTELHIQEGLHFLRQGRTSFVVAHRLSTIASADQILVMDRGEIVDRGTHDELVSREGLYSTLYRSQTEPVLEA